MAPASTSITKAMALMQIGSGYNVVAVTGAELVWSRESELYTWTSSVLDAGIFPGFVLGTLFVGRFADTEGRLKAHRL